LKTNREGAKAAKEDAKEKRIVGFSKNTTSLCTRSTVLRIRDARRRFEGSESRDLLGFLREILFILVGKGVARGALVLGNRGEILLAAISIQLGWPRVR
jgi:hypothetical protein